MPTPTKSRMPIVLVLALLVAAGAMLGPQLLGTLQDGPRKVTFTATVGDGKIWAGGFRMVYAIGNQARTVDVQALPRTDPRKNTVKVTKVVAVGTSVSVTAYADWPNTLVVVQLRGQGVDPRPVQALSPRQPVKVDTVK